MAVRTPIGETVLAAPDRVERLDTRADIAISTKAVAGFLEQAFDWLPLDVPQSSQAQPGLVVFHLGFFLACRATGLSGRLTRRRTRIDLDGVDHLLVSIPLRGGIGFGDGSLRRLHPGEAAISDLGTEFACTLLESDSIHLVIPRLFMPQAVAPPDAFMPRLLTGQRLATRALIELAQMLTGLIDHADRREAMALAAVMRIPLAFCIGTVNEGTTRMDPRARGRQLRRHIEDNLGDADLAPATLADRFGMSRSQLFRVFEAAGGVETFVRNRRLRTALLALSDPALLHRRIGDIAYEAGFSDEAHFSRLFRNAYGQSPRAFRKEARNGRLPGLTPKQPPADNAAERLLLWLDQLGDA